MRKARSIVKPAVAMAFALAVAGCATITRNHGYVPEEADLEAVVVGVDTRDTVADTIGAPSASGVMRDDAWYYVASKWETRGAFAPEEVERQVVAISFDEGGLVRNIERFTLEDGAVVTLNRRVTEDNIKGVSFIRQLLGNIGNFTAEQFIDN